MEPPVEEDRGPQRLTRTGWASALLGRGPSLPVPHGKDPTVSLPRKNTGPRELGRADGPAIVSREAVRVRRHASWVGPLDRRPDLLFPLPSLLAFLLILGFPIAFVL